MRGNSGRLWIQSCKGDGVMLETMISLSCYVLVCQEHKAPRIITRLALSLVVWMVFLIEWGGRIIRRACQMRKRRILGDVLKSNPDEPAGPLWSN